MLVQIITVDRSPRPDSELQELAGRLRARGHEVLIRRFEPAPTYRGRSRDENEVVKAIWASHQACWRLAKEQGTTLTLVLEDDCDIDDERGIGIAQTYLEAHPGDVDLFFLGASPNCWWKNTDDRRVVRYTHVYWWHALIVTRSFIDRYGEAPRTWRCANDIHFSKLIASGAVRAYGLRAPVAFQRGRRSRLAESVLYRFPWGDGRRLAGAALALLGLWILSRR